MARQFRSSRGVLVLLAKLVIATAATGVGGSAIGFLPSPLNGGLDPLQGFLVGCVGGFLAKLTEELLKKTAGE